MNRLRNSISRNALIGAGAAVALGLAARAVVRSKRYIDLRGRTVIITGGSRGLGLNLARVCAGRGANMAICARDQAELNRAVEELRLGGARVIAAQCDVTKQEQVNEFIRSVVETFGTIDVLINNAGIISVGPMEEMTVADYEDAMATHFYAALYTTLAVLPIMRVQREGRIVNIASIGGKVAVPHLLPYSASKFALVGFSEGLRGELQKDNILVTTVTPGLFRSGSARNAMFKGRHREEFAWFATGAAMPVLSISVERLARRILDAAQHGDAELITPFTAKVQAKFAALMPNLTGEIMALINALLPSAGGVGARRVPGYESESSRVPTFAQRRNNHAARENNEMNGTASNTAL